MKQSKGLNGNLKPEHYKYYKQDQDDPDHIDSQEHFIINTRNSHTWAQLFKASLT